MALLRVRILGDPILRATAAPVTRFDDALKRLADDMLETMDDAPGVGLAAPQVGRSIQMFVYDTGEEGERGGLCNPKITWLSQETIDMEEGCLSIPGIALDVTRPEAIMVEAQTLKGDPVTIETGGFRARVFQHEIDHLNGILFIDHLPREIRKQAMAALREQDFGLSPPPTEPFGTG
ncbi:MAG: peptide deformylase [Actinomycetota bacterium]